MTSIPRTESIYAPTAGYYLVKKKSVMAYQKTKEQATTIIQDLHEEAISCYQDVKTECSPSNARESTREIFSYLSHFYHIPYLPAFHSPGWLLRYIVGPYDREWFDGITSDIPAGLTVGLLMIPQALSYAGLANLPQVNGLYAAILPSAFYTFFGSSLQLAVGPVALASLLTGTLVLQYNAIPGTQSAVNVGAQAAISVGFLLVVMSAFNLGNMIHYVSRPVMSGFTTGAAMIIGMSQLKVQN
jgi:hypothetical protein